MTNLLHLRHRRPALRTQGFTLVELAVALAMFMVLGLAAVQLTQRSTGITVDQQAQSSLNLTTRNVSSQMEIDLINAGTGYFPTSDIPGAPLGVTVAATANNAFDTVSILSFDRTAISKPVDGTNTTGTSIAVTPVAPATLSSIKNAYTGAELLLVTDSANQQTGRPWVTTVPVSTTSQGTSTVTLTLAPSNTVLSYVNTACTNGSWPNDPLAISVTGANATGVDSNSYCYLRNTFDSTDWVLKTQSIKYSVNGNGQLVRTVNGVDAVIADNIISFKVGVMTTGGTVFLYPPAPYDPRNIRALRLSFLVRSSPDPTNPFQNALDQGHYRIEGASIMVNPRNLSLHD